MKKDPVNIVKKLRDNGHEAYLVGGCVRDLLLGVAPKDYDIATSATPDEVSALFSKTIPVGARFGVVIVRFRKASYEVATFREDADYGDGRRPDRVRFSTARADARRRDFTINGLFHDPIEDRVIDYVGGKKDLASGVVRAIGDAEARFGEDKLRLMRAVRFASRLGFRIEKKTGAAIVRHVAEIDQVSGERVRDELVAILLGDPAAGIRMMDEYGLLGHVLPEVADMKGVDQPPEFHPEGDVFEHTMIMLDAVARRYAKNIELLLGALLHDVGKPPTMEMKDRITFNNHTQVGVDMARRLLRRLRFSNETRNAAADLVGQHMRFMNVTEMRPAKLKKFLRMDNFDLHMELHRLDCLASHGGLDNYKFCKAKLRELDAEPERLRPKPLITGNDLIEMGLEPGPPFKKILASLEDAQLEGEIKTKQEAMAWVREIVKGSSR